MFQELTFINELHELYPIIQYTTECSSPLILWIFCLPQQFRIFRDLKKSQKFFGSYFLPRRTSEGNESCELRYLPHCALCTLPWRFYFKVKNFSALLWYTLFLDLCKKNPKYIITTATLLHVLGRWEGKKRSQSEVSVLKQLTDFSSVTWIT